MHFVFYCIERDFFFGGGGGFTFFFFPFCVSFVPSKKS